MYQILLLLHILGAVVWVGGAVTVQLLAVRVQRSDDVAELPRFTRHLAAVGDGAYRPAALVIIVTGTLMTAQAWSFAQAWILGALALWLLSAVAGATYLGPRARRAAALFEAEGPASADGRALLARLFRVSRIELVSFAVIIALMVYKPGA